MPGRVSKNTHGGGRRNFYFPQQAATLLCAGSETVGVPVQLAVYFFKVLMIR